MAKVKILKNERVMKMPKNTFPQYLSTELIHKMQSVSSESNIPVNWIAEYALRKALGLSIKEIDIKEIVVA